MVMPVFFFGHGSPTNVREDNAVTRQWRALAQSIPRPSAIIMISAHWVASDTRATATDRPRTIHDFSARLGADLFEYQYPAPGCPELIDRVAMLLGPEIPLVKDMDWGFDHGTWAVLYKAWPAADIPVIQLSLLGEMPSATHITIGERLRPLRRDGVLICGSGNIVHNLNMMEWNEDAMPYPWASAFNDAIKKALANRDADTLADPWTLGEPARLSLPTAEHYVPLLYAFGAAQADDQLSFSTDFIQYRSLSMTSICWHSAEHLTVPPAALR